MIVQRGKVVSFELQRGRRIGTPYEVVQRMGAGTEGEVYKILETDTGIHRAAKLYFPHHNQRGRATVWYARKLNRLRHCSIVLHYYHTQEIQISRQKVLCLISELVAGSPVAEWTSRQKGGRLAPYMALHVLYELARGLEEVHAVGEYHADVHTENILIEPRGVGFQLKLVDFYNWGGQGRYKQQQDIVDAINVFYECLGGARFYAGQADPIRHICAGLQRSLLLRRFPTMSALRLHLESFPWDRLD